MKKILVIEDDADIRSNILALLSAEELDALGAADGLAGVAEARRWRPDLVVCNIRVPGLDGYQVLAALRADPATETIPLIFLTAKADRSAAREGMEHAADDYVTRPFSRNELLGAIRARLTRAERPADELEPPPSEESALLSPTAPAEDDLVVLDPGMKQLYAQAALAAAQSVSVLILGETGVGKRILANEIHRLSPRAKKPLLALECSALSDSVLFGYEKRSYPGVAQTRVGLLESATGGTVFLHEVGDLPMAIQIELVRVLEDGQLRRLGGRTTQSVDVRFVSATNRDLAREIECGAFREDLFCRLDGLTLTVPPLRDRICEIEPLARAFVRRACSDGGRSRPPSLSDDAVGLLESHGWPGNVGELRDVISHAMVLCTGPTLLPEHLLPRMRAQEAPRSAPGPAAGRARVPQLAEELEAIQRQRLIEALRRCHGNQTFAAELLGVSRRTLVRMLEDHDLPRPRKRSSSEGDADAQ